MSLMSFTFLFGFINWAGDCVYRSQCDLKNHWEEQGVAINKIQDLVFALQEEDRLERKDRCVTDILILCHSLVSPVTSFCHFCPTSLAGSCAKL